MKNANKNTRSWSPRSSFAFSRAETKCFFGGRNRRNRGRVTQVRFFSGQTQKGSSKGTHVPFHLETPFPITFHVDDFSSFHVSFRSSFFFSPKQFGNIFFWSKFDFLKKILFRGNFAKFFKSKIWKNKNKNPGPKSWNYYAQNDLKI